VLGSKKLKQKGHIPRIHIQLQRNESERTQTVISISNRLIGTDCQTFRSK